MQHGSRLSLSNMAAISLLFGVCFFQATAARSLLTGGDVESETTVHTDPDGGIPPLSERIEKVSKDQELQYKLLEAEAECHKRHAEECPEVEAIKAKMSPSPEAPAPEPVTAPCYQNIIASYFLGVVCDLPPDSKNDGNDRPAPEAEEESGSRKLLAWLRR